MNEIMWMPGRQSFTELGCKKSEHKLGIQFVRWDCVSLGMFKENYFQQTFPGLELYEVNCRTEKWTH